MNNQGRLPRSPLLAEAGEAGDTLTSEEQVNHAAFPLCVVALMLFYGIRGLFIARDRTEGGRESEDCSAHFDDRTSAIGCDERRNISLTFSRVPWWVCVSVCSPIISIPLPPTAQGLSFPIMGGYLVSPGAILPYVSVSCATFAPLRDGMGERKV